MTSEGNTKAFLRRISCITELTLYYWIQIAYQMEFNTKNLQSHGWKLEIFKKLEILT